MSIAPGTRLGSYEVVSLLGAGGMGEVYRARDTRLQREVAIKVLPAAFASDPDRLARFEREAQLLASLNHPNIGAIYGLEDKALILELVDGPTLADRIAQGALPLDEAVPIARQIAEALEIAHEQGVIHRDLKPANIKLRGDGTVKVLDFGLAKLHEPNAAEASSAPNFATLSPTVLSPAATQIGVILGTAAYMSPEQAKGRPADRRADMWAFGCVLFEMLTGRRVFDGDDVTDFVVAVLSREPDWSRLPATTPPSVERLIRRCLAKDRRQRLADAASARLELDDAAVTSSVTTAPTTGGWRTWVPWSVAVAAATAAAVILATRSTVPLSVVGGVRFDLSAPGGTMLPPGFSSYLVSPDGQRIVFEAVSAGSRRSLWVRRLDSPRPTEVPGTDGARGAAWSFDGASLAFFAGGKLRRADVAGGGAQTLADAINAGAAWGAGDVILFGVNEGLRSIPGSGGASVAVTTVDKSRGEVSHSSPHFLPDGRRFLYLAVNNDPNASAVVLASLDDGERRNILSGTSNAVYSDGHLLYVRDGALMAQAFDPDQGALTGQPVVVSESVKQAPNGRAAFAAAGGTVVFDPSRDFAEAEFAILSRTGIDTEVFAVRSPAHTMWPSADFRRVVVESGGSIGSTDLWIIDGDRNSRTRLTDAVDTEGHPVWSPDGKQIAFFDGLVGVRSRLVVSSATGIGAPRVIIDTPTYKQVTDWSRDGKLLVFEEQSPATSWDIGIVPLDGSAPPKTVVNTRFTERLGALSPDGRFLAYVSNETGRPEVYVVNVPGVTEKWPVSSGGGTKPRWRGDGGELFFLSDSNVLMSVTIKSGTGFVPTVAQRLFDLQVIGSDGWDYAVSDDGQRFLAMRYSGLGVNANVSVIADWPATLRR
jgi:serine/threonine protein kinase/Tol biopolymer transport system component